MSNNRIFSNIVANPSAGRPSNFGSRNDPINPGTTRQHNGVDISTPVGTPLHTPADGVVYYVGTMSGYGNTLVIAHPNSSNPTSFTMYAHLQDGSTNRLNVGGVVNQGDQIALSGNTGSRTTGPHLHYEERVPLADQRLPEPSSATPAGDLRGAFLLATPIDPRTNQLGFGTWDPALVPRENLTRNERVDQLRMTDAEFDAYRYRVATIETGSNLNTAIAGRSDAVIRYDTNTGNGAYGAYQLRVPALREAGFMDAQGNWTDKAQALGVNSFASFVASPQAQDAALRALTDRNATFLVQRDADLRVGDTVNGVPVTEAGLSLAAHHRRESVVTFVETGEDTSARGNPAISSYFRAATGLTEQGGATSTTPEQPLEFARRITLVSEGSPSLPTPLPHRPNAPNYPEGSVVHNTDGSTTFSSVITRDPSADSGYQRGDRVTQTFDTQGQLVSQTISRRENGVPVSHVTEIDHQTGQRTDTQLDGSGVVQTRITTDSATGQVVGESYVIKGVSYPVNPPATGAGADGNAPNGLVSEVDNYDLQTVGGTGSSASNAGTAFPLSADAENFLNTFVGMLRQPQPINSNSFDASQVLAGSGHGGVQTDGGLMAGGFSLTGGGSGVGGSTGSGLLPAASAPIVLGAQMANAAPLFQTPTGGAATEVTQLHIDIINASPTAQAMYQWAIENNVPIVIRNGSGSSFNPDRTDNPNGTITLDASLFNSTTNQGSSEANAVHNAAGVVMTGVHELGHAFNNATGQSPVLNPGTFTSPSDYAVARAHTEGLSYVVEGQVDSELVGQSFMPAGGSQAVTITPSTYGAGGDWAFDANLQRFFSGTGAPVTRAEMERTGQLFNLGQNPTTAAGGNYLNQGLVDYAAYWSGVPASQIRGVQVDDDGRSWSVTSQSGISLVTTSFGTINTSLPQGGQQAISQSISTGDDDGNLLVTTTNHSTGASTATLIGPDQTVIRTVDIPALNPGQPSTTSTTPNSPVTPPADFWNGAGVEPFQHQLAPAAAAPVGAPYAGTGIATGSLPSFSGGAGGVGSSFVGPLPYGVDVSDLNYVNGADLQSDQASAANAQALFDQQAQQQGINAAFSFANTLLSLGRWDEMSDLQRASVLVGGYNALANASSMDGVLPLPGWVGGGLGLFSAIESGNVLAGFSSALQLVDWATAAYAAAATSAGTSAAGAAVATNFAGTAVPFINLVMAFQSDNPALIAANAGVFALAFTGSSWAGPAAIVVAVVAWAVAEWEGFETRSEAGVRWDDEGRLTTHILANDEDDGGQVAQGVLDQLLLGEHGAQNQLTQSYDARLAAYQQALLDPEQSALAQLAGPPEEFVINPAHLPRAGYYNDNGAQSLFMTWTNEQGQSVTRYYDMNGRHGGSEADTLAADFGAQLEQALVPAWVMQTGMPQFLETISAVEPLQAQIDGLVQEAVALGGNADFIEAFPINASNPGDGSDYFEYSGLVGRILDLRHAVDTVRNEATAALGQLPTYAELFQTSQVSSNGQQQSMQALSFELALDGDALQAQAAQSNPITPRDQVMVNLDGDQYLERVNWVGSNQALLGIDLSGDGRLQANELLTTNLDWMDANHDGRIDASDPAFAAIRVWVDVNSDGSSVGYLRDAQGELVLGPDGKPQISNETQGLGQAGITAIDLNGGGSGVPSISREDGSSQALTEETLTGETLGVMYTQVQGLTGVMEITEQADGSGDKVFYGINTRELDNDPNARHGGEVADARWTGHENIHAGDARMQSTGNRTVENTSVQTHTVLQAGDERIQNGGLGTVLRGQNALAQTRYTVGAGDVVSHGGPNGGQPSPLNGSVGNSGSLDDTYAVRVDLHQQAPVSTTGLPQGVARQTVVVDGPANHHPADTHGGTPWVPPAAPVVLAPTVQAGQVADVQVHVALRPEQIQVGAAGRVLAGQDAQQGASGEAVVVSLQTNAHQVTSNGQVFRVASPSAAPIVVNAGDARVSSAPLSSQALAALATAQGNSSNAAPTRVNQPIAFVPVQTSTQTRLDVTADMIRSADGSLFGSMGPAALSAGLMGVALGAGAAQTPAPGGQQRTVGAAELDANWSDLGLAVRTTTGTSANTILDWEALNRSLQDQPASIGGGPAAVGEPWGGTVRPGLVFRQVDLGAVTSVAVSPELAGGAVGVALLGGNTSGSGAAVGTAATTVPDSTNTSPDATVPVGAAGQAFMVPTWVEPSRPSDQANTPNTPPSAPAAPVLITPSVGVPGAPATAPAVSGTTNSPPPAVVAPLSAFALNDLSLLGQEDVGLMMDLRLLLQAGGSSPDAAGLVLTSVGNPSHGTVSLQMLPGAGAGAGGTPTLHAVFIPDANHFGSASFTYTVSNQDGVSLTATARIDLAPVNDAPVVLGESLSGLEDEGLVFTAATLLANDTDVDAGDALTISRVDSAQNGVVLLNGAGEVVFVPQPNYSGPAGFTYWVQDTAGVEVRSTVQLNIAQVNDAPVVVGETVNSNEDTVLSFAAGLLLANDSDLEASNSNLSLQSVGGAQHGSVQLQTLPDGSQAVLFTPQLNYFGVAGFSYTVSDGSGGSNTTTVVINLAEVNDAPVAVADASTGTEDAVLRIPVATLLANDTDADAGNLLLNSGAAPVSLTISQVGNALHGSVVLGVNPTTGAPEVQFTPDENYFGPASFTYTVQDGRGGQSSALANLTIASLNDAPVATDESVASDEDAVLLINPAALLANEVDVDTSLTNLTVSAVANATHGVVVLQNDGVIRFTPEENYVGDATFDYTVSDGQGGLATATATITLANVNDAPVLVGETIAGTEDTALQVAGTALLANDSDIDTPHAELVITSVGNATHGSVLLQPNGSVRFTPALNYNASMGPATFEYTVSDGQGGQTVGVATLNIAAVNDAPVATGETITDLAEDTVATFAPGQLLLNDSDVDNAATQLQVTGVGGATNGSVVLNADGSVVFTPTLNYSGPSSFNYTVSDGAGGLSQATVSLDFVAVNDAPTLVNDAVAATEDTAVLIPVAQFLANDSDVDNASSALVVTAVTAIAGSTHGSVLLEAGGLVRFTPDANFNGTASFSYTVSDGAGGLSTATALVNVASVNDGPSANADVLPAQLEDTNLVITAAALLANDVDVDVATNGQVLQISSVTALPGQTHGTVSLNASGDVSFVPDANYAGPVAFGYTVSDGAGGTSSSVATLTLSNVNDAPALMDDLFVGKNRSVVEIAAADLLFNDHDADTPYTGDTLTLVSVSGATHGSVSLLPSGDVRFTPNAGYVGMAQFNYTVVDSHGATSSAVAQVDLTNQAPTVVGETINTSEDTVTSIASALLLANDSDADNAFSDLRVTGVGGAINGTVSLSAQGLVTFTPNTNFNGLAQFSYSVGDGDDGTGTGIATVNVAAVNDAPLVVGETVALQEDQVAHFTTAALLSNDSDIETPNSLSIVAVLAGAGGTAALTGNQVTFTPWLNYNGVANFNYLVSDGQGGFTQARVDVNYAPVNDAPVANGEYFSGLQDTSYFFGWDALLANDVDAETPNYALSGSLVWGAQNGSVSWDGGGVTFTPNANFVGTASFNYAISDGDGALSNPATAYIDLAHVNHNPVATDDTFGLQEDAQGSYGLGQLLANDFDQDWPYGDVLSVSQVANGVNGTVSITPGSHVSFVPTSNFYGQASFQYQVVDGKGGSTWATANINVVADNDAPVINAVTYDTALDGTQFVMQNWQVVDQYAVDDLSRTNGWITAADIDTPTSNLRYSISQYAFNGSSIIDALSGAWRYESNGYVGSESFTVEVSDQVGGRSYVTVAVVAGHAPLPIHLPSDNGGGGSDYPVVIDLGNDGLDLIRPEDSNVWVDVNDDGQADRLGWAAASEAVLVLDERGDGVIDQRHEYSFVGYTPGATTDLEGLRAFDSNADRLLSAADRHWAQFGLFQDTNVNGRQDAGEFVRITDTEITSISLVRDGQREEVNGNVVFGTSEVRLADGSSTRAGDVMFNTAPISTATAPATPSFATRSTGGSAPLLPSTSAVTAAEGSGAVPSALVAQTAATSSSTVSTTATANVTALATVAVSSDSIQVLVPASATTVATATAPTVTSAHVSTTTTAPQAVAVPASSLVSLVVAPPVVGVTVAAPSAFAAPSPALTPAPASASVAITHSTQTVGVSVVPVAVSAGHVADRSLATTPAATPSASSAATPVVAPILGVQPDAAVTARDFTATAAAPGGPIDSAAAALPDSPTASAAATISPVDLKDVAPTAAPATSATPSARDPQATASGASDTAPLHSSDIRVLPDAASAQTVASDPTLASREALATEASSVSPAAADKETTRVEPVGSMENITSLNPASSAAAASVEAVRPASDAEIAQQALLLNSWSNAGVTSPNEAALAFVPAASGGIEVIVNLDTQSLPEAANSPNAPQSGASVAVG